MQSRTVSLSLILFMFAIGHARAQDTTHHKRPWFISLGGGYNSTKVFGKLLDKVGTYSTQKNGGSFEINFSAQKQLSELPYIKIGISYLQKRVNPGENPDVVVYKDTLQTGYLSVPLALGLMIPLDPKKRVFFSLEAGLSGNFKISGRSYHGPDQAGFKTLPVVLGAQGSGGVIVKLSSLFRLQFLYTYRRDLTDAYRENLYWDAGEATRTAAFGMRTNSFSAGLMLEL